MALSMSDFAISILQEEVRELVEIHLVGGDIIVGGHDLICNRAFAVDDVVKD